MPGSTARVSATRAAQLTAITRAEAPGVAAGEQQPRLAGGEPPGDLRTDAGGGAGHDSQVRQLVRHGVLLRVLQLHGDLPGGAVRLVSQAVTVMGQAAF